LARAVPAAPLRPVRREGRRGGRLLALAGAGLLGVYLVLLGWRSAEPSGLLHADVWNFWLPKAKTIFYFGGLDTGVGGFTSQTSPDYPPLLPALEATAFRFVGGADALALPLAHWVVAVAFFGALAGLLAGRVRPAILWPALALLAFMPMLGRLIGSSLADEPLALLVALAGVCGVASLEEREWRLGLLAGVFLVAATLTKNEGLMLAVVLAVALALAARSRRAWLTGAALAAAALAAFLVWKAWLDRHGVPGNYAYDFGDLLRPGYLADRVERLEYGAGQLLEQLVSPSRWLVTVPATLALAVAIARRRSDLTTLVLATTVLAFLGYATVYWISSVELHFYVDNNVDRVVAPTVVLLGALFPLLLEEALSTP
jgi:4-amino-4-deoxy-L-arabinose transferase-like glycosyltransferase